jgi:hypothetical protein
MLGWRASWEKDSTVASPGDSPPPPLRDASRCVILSRGDDISPGFLASLKQRGVETVIIGRPLLAFAELLVMERERGPSAGWGLPERNRTLFIVADRERWEHLDQLLSAIRSHLPRVAVWIAAADFLLDVTEPPRSAGEEDILAGLPRLRLTGGAEESAGLDPTLPQSDSAEEEQEGDFSETPDERDLTAEQELEEDEGADGPAISPSPSNSAAVTPEEIEMLLRVLPPTPPPHTPKQPGGDGGPRTGGDR